MVGFGGNQAQAALPAGTHAFYVHLAAGSGKAVTVTPLSPAPSQCLTGVTVGTWQPAPSGPPIPAVAGGRMSVRCLPGHPHAAVQIRRSARARAPRRE